MENRIISVVDSPEPPRNVSMRDGGLVVQVGGKNDAEKKATKTKIKLDYSKTFKMVFCHLEFLRSSSSVALHLTQLAANPFPAAPDHMSVFLPVVPPVLAEYLDHYKVGGDLMQTLTMTREDKDTFLFRPPILVEEVQRVVCVPESVALSTFLDFLEMIGPNIILVGLDEDSVGVLMQKLKESNRARFLTQVEGYTWWRRILKYSSYPDYKDLSLEEFYKSTFSPPPTALLTCSLVAERLKQAVKEVACRKGFISVSGGKFVSAVAVPVQARPRLEEREVREGLEVLEVVNNYLSIPVISFAVSRMEQVNIDLDDKSSGHLSIYAAKKKSGSLGKAIKQEQNGEAFSIYISSDSDTEDMVLSLAPRPILHRPQSLALTLTTAPVPNSSPAQDIARSQALGWRGAHSLPKSLPFGTNANIPPHPSVNGWRIVDRSQGGKMVICPVCHALVDLQSTIVHGDTEKWGLLEEHMREHLKHETNTWSRPCLVCVDRGDLFTRVAPDWLRTHISSDHQVNGPFISAPPSQPFGNSSANVPQPVQKKLVSHPGPDPAPNVKFWEFVDGPNSLFVVCPCCPPTMNIACRRLNPAKVTSHLERVHQIDSLVQLCDRKCQGCNVAVPPDQLVKHIACQETTMGNEASLKRKAPTDAKTGKKKTFNAKVGKYMAVHGSSSSVKGPIIKLIRDHGSG